MIVTPSASVNRYWTLLATGADMKRGPTISRRVGRLMACTWPHKWPLLLPRSRYQRPPGQGSSFMGIAVPSGISLASSCSSRAANVTSSDALTRISWFTVKDRLSISERVAVIVSPWRYFGGRDFGGKDFGDDFDLLRGCSFSPRRVA